MGRAALGIPVSLLLVLTAIPAAAEVYEHIEGGIVFDAPNDWNVEVDEEVISLETPDETLFILFWVPEADTWETALDELGREIESVIQDPTIHEEKETKLNGMPMYEVAGSGRVEGVDVEWSFALVLARKPVIALAFSEPEEWKRNLGALESFVKSIRKRR